MEIDLISSNINALREPHKGVISHMGTMLQSQTGETCPSDRSKVNYKREVAHATVQKVTA